jgi:AcrR family transcriptional regulator
MRMTKPRRSSRRRSTRRPYAGAHRQRLAAQTRAAILDAAKVLFATKGWAGVGMRDIARQAGVAVETVYSSVGPKVAVLLAAIKASVAVGDPAVPLMERPEVRVLAEGDFAERAAAAAQLTAVGNARTIGLHKAFREGAAGDPSLAASFAEYVVQRRGDYLQVITLVARRSLGQIERDGLWAVLSRDVYELLVERSGWTLEQYRAWTEQMIVHLLTRDE